MSSARVKALWCPESIPRNGKWGIEPYYPINNDENNALYKKYEELAGKEENVIFGGRLGKYKYYDMDKVIAAALQTVKEEFEQ